MKRFSLFLIIAILIISSLSLTGMATYPERTISIIVGYSAGGSTDLMARFIAEGLEKELGQKVVVINRPGAGGEIGFTDVAKAKPDGYTLGTVNLPGLINLTLMRPDTVQFSVDDFEKIANIVLDPSTITVNVDSPFQNLTDLIDYAKEHPKAVTIGNSGVGSSSDMETLYFNTIMDIETTAVPFEGDAGVRAALLGSHIMAAAIKISEADPYLAQGTMRILGVMADERLPKYPDIPTFKEQGVDIVSSSARGIAGPKGIPQDIIETLSKAIEKVVKSDFFVQKAADMNMPLYYLSPEEYKEFFKSQEVFAKKLLEVPGEIK